MKELLFLRHGKSSWLNTNINDHDRPLSKRGINNAPKMGDIINKLCPDLELVLYSSSLRTKQTLDLIKKHINLNSKIIVSPELYLASDTIIWNIINQNRSDYQKILVIAHNPGLFDVVNSIRDKRKEYILFPTCALAYVKSKTNQKNNWFQNDFELISIFKPKEILKK